MKGSAGIVTALIMYGVTAAIVLFASIANYM